MVKIDLITGFLGSGKTTFIKKYAEHLISMGQNICILENDFGAVNVDMMLLQDLMGENCELEMVAGGCDADCHKRRFKTKLISMGMCGYDRVLVEPSGIFDVDEFFDTLREDPLDRWYEIGTVFTIVDANLSSSLSVEAEYLLASQLAPAGCVLLSKIATIPEEERNIVLSRTVNQMNSVMEKFHCNRRFTISLDDIQATSDNQTSTIVNSNTGDKTSSNNRKSSINDITFKDWNLFANEDFSQMMNAGYHLENHVKLWFDHKDAFDSVYFMNLSLSTSEIIEKANILLTDTSYGNIFRIKGFVPEENQWLEINLTHMDKKIEPIKEGQNVIIVIGENLNKNNIEELFASIS